MWKTAKKQLDRPFPTENKLTLFWKKGKNKYLIATKSIKKRVETSVNLGCNLKMVEKVTFVGIMYSFSPFFLCNEKSDKIPSYFRSGYSFEVKIKALFSVRRALSCWAWKLSSVPN